MFKNNVYMSNEYNLDNFTLTTYKKPNIQLSKITTIYNRLDLMKRSPSGAHSKNTTPNQLAATKQAK